SEIVIVAELQDAVIDCLLAGRRRNREELLCRDVLVEKLRVVQIAEDVAIQDEEILRQIADQLKRPHRAQRRGLKRRVDADIPSTAVAEIGTQQIGDGGRWNIRIDSS